MRSRILIFSFFNFLLDSVRSRESYNLYCTTLLSGAQTKFKHQCDVITFQPYTVYRDRTWLRQDSPSKSRKGPELTCQPSPANNPSTNIQQKKVSLKVMYTILYRSENRG